LKQKKIPKRYLQNLDTKINNIREIYYLVKDEKYTQADIISKTKLSRPTVKSHLKMMIEKKMIETKEILNNSKEKRIIYTLITINPAKIKSFETYLETLTKNGGAVFRDYSELRMILNICSLPWGIEPQTIINKKLAKLKLLKQEDVEEIEKLLFKKIMTNVEDIKNYRSKYGKEPLEFLKDDNFVLSFNINLDKVHESIKQKSLEKLENMSTEEISSKFDADDAEIDDSVFDE